MNNIRGVISIQQQDYIKRIKETHIENKNEKSKPLNDVEQTELRAICGQLNWIANQSRPDLSFFV